ncbi:fumarylacetoacetate hydrolase family protein [Azospirillum melinis]
MKICRFNDDRIGLVIKDRVIDVSTQARQTMESLSAATAGDPLVVALSRLQDILGNAIPTGSMALADVELLAPVKAPGKLIAAPINYRAHIAEMLASNISPGHNLTDIRKAGLFLKASSSLVGPSQGIAQRFLDRRTDHELELAVVIGRTACNVSVTDALSHVAGYCIGLDITVRGTEERSFRKSIDSYSVLGPWLTTADEIPNPNALHLSLTLNGELRQEAVTADMVMSVAELIAFASSFYTLHPGDVLYTGTPQGVGPIRPGDLLQASCPDLGSMDVAVSAYAPTGNS